MINAWYGLILAIVGQHDRAIEQLRKTVELDPNFKIAHYRLGQEHAQMGMYNDVIDEFDKVLKPTGW